MIRPLVTGCYVSFTKAALCVLLFVTVVAESRAQNQFGQITGLVVDSQGGSVPGADLTIRNQQTGVTTKTVTNAGGNYTVTSLVAGKYDVSASKSGFSTVTHEAVRLEVGQIARVDITLRVGQVTQQVVVKASDVLLETESATVGTVVPESGVVNLPLNGRNYLQLATLVPGTNSAGLGQHFFGMPENNLNINGMKASASTYVIDGADVTENFTSGSPYTPAPDAIQEFKVETNNMTAEFGGGGAIVNVALKTGTNKFHGGVYEFVRNNVFNARNYFALTTPELRFNQFGGLLGGPIKKDRIFFFGDYQGTRIVQGNTSNVVVPTAAMMQGDFSGLPQIYDPYTGQPLQGNKIPQISPQAAYFLKFFPTANTPGGTYVQTANANTVLDQYDIRVDAHPGASDLIAYTWSQEIGSNSSGGSLPLNGGTSGPNKGEFTNVNWTHTFGPNRVNQANMSYARETATTTGQGIGTNYTVQSGIGGFEDASLQYPGPPSLNISGYASISGYPFLPLGQIYNHYNFNDTFIDVIGRHTLLIGGGARWYDEFNYNGAWSRGSFAFTGTYTGNGFADFLYGVPFTGERGFPRNLFGGYQRSQNLFIQDTWKASPALTVIGGFRWDVIHPTVAMHNMAASANPLTNQIIVASDANGKINTTTQQLTAIVLPLFESRIVPSSTVGLPNSLVFTNWHNFAPRIGFAYQVPSWGMVVRSGYGIFYPIVQGNQAVSTPGANAPFIVDQPETNSTPVPSVTLANMFPPTTPGNYALGPVLNNQLNPHLPDQYIQEWNLTVEKNIGGIVSAQVAYVGSKGTHLPFLNVQNVPLPGPGNIQSRRPNTFFSEGFYLSDIGRSSYNSLQVTATTHSWRGLYALGSYTWGKSLDDGSQDPNNGSSVQDPNNLKSQYGISDYNLASRFTAAVTYQLPSFSSQKRALQATIGGWSLSNIVTLQTGPVFTPTLSTDPANTGTTERPDQSGNGNRSHPTIQQWFNVAAFSVPAPYTFGNASRNTVTGPPLKNWDFGVSKKIASSHFWEGEQALQFRGEFFNFMNTPPFGLPNAGIQTSTAGQVLSAGAPRTAQLSLKLLF